MTMETNGTQETQSTECDENNSSNASSGDNLKTKKIPPGELINVEAVETKSDENDNEDFVLGDTSNYSIKQRNELFQKGIEFERDAKPDFALKCYLSCMKGLQHKTRFVLLPECLKNIAEIYQAKGEFTNAIHFAQAEKLFYETALIETQEIQRKIEEVAGRLDIDSSITKDINDLNIQALRAEEYEHLAKLCLERQQSELALEYAGKCAKIRQEVYGSDHEKTKETLDFFATVYGDVGKAQYSDSINSLGDVGQDGEAEEDQVAPEIVHSNMEAGEPVSILRHRKVAGEKADGKDLATGKEKEKKKKVHFDQAVHESIRRKQRESARNWLIVFAIVVTFALGYWLT